MGPNFLFRCIIALIYHLSVQFPDVDFQEIFGKHPVNSGNILSQTGFFLRKFTFSNWFFPGNLLSQTGFYFPGISLSDRMWSGERTTGNGNILRIFLQCGELFLLLLQMRNQECIGTLPLEELCTLGTLNNMNFEP
jgi:hypothetical protein